MRAKFKVRHYPLLTRPGLEFWWSNSALGPNRRAAPGTRYRAFPHPLTWVSSQLPRMGLSHAMPRASLQALLVAYQAQIDWLLAQAEDFESGARKVSGRIGGKEVDLSPNLATEYRHKAGNMQAIMQAYERLHAKEDNQCR